ncbi:hypothetical protein [Streptomyces sp. T028]|uniref:hypothetical protein n=1 Tax=Streptomyces sp. T028 TaxID=3394379 RepID=UPI003A8B7944
MTSRIRWRGCTRSNSTTCPGPLSAAGASASTAPACAHAAWATRGLWRPELEDHFEDPEGESAELIWGQHAGLAVEEFAYTDFLDAAELVPLLGCTCGIWVPSPTPGGEGVGFVDVAGVREGHLEDDGGVGAVSQEGHDDSDAP